MYAFTLEPSRICGGGDNPQRSNLGEVAVMNLSSGYDWSFVYSYYGYITTVSVPCLCNHVRRNNKEVHLHDTLKL